MLLLLGFTGITLIIVRGDIFQSVRQWLLAKRPKDIGYLFTCCQCVGFWVGLLGGLVYADLLMVPLYAGAVSLLAMITDNWMLKNRVLRGQPG
jgi:hypothetical protein